MPLQKPGAGSRKRKWAGAALWSVFGLILMLHLFARLLPQNLTDTRPGYARLVQIAFFAQVLGFHLGLLDAVILTTAALLRRWRLAAAALVPAALVLGPVITTAWPRTPPPMRGPGVCFMSMNLKYFNRDGPAIVRQIREHNPSVLLLEDYTPFAQDTLDSEFGPDYPHRKLVPEFGQGLAIYSRLPFADGDPTVAFGKLRRQMRAVVNLDGQPVAVYVVHPYSPRTRKRIITNRLETADLVNQIQREKLPVIVSGDFNFTAETANAAAMVKAGMVDAFDLAGQGRGSTWPVDPPLLAWLPGVRIDHFYLSPSLTCSMFAVGGYDGSDHLPIVARMGWR